MISFNPVKEQKPLMQSKENLNVPNKTVSGVNTLAKKVTFAESVTECEKKPQSIDINALINDLKNLELEDEV